MKIDHTHPEYAARREVLGPNGMYNGAYYYSVEIVKNIIPLVKTNRPWVTINQPGACFDHAIFFAHKNTNFERYAWLKDFDDLVIVCSTPLTAKYMKKYGKTIFLPLSVDVNYVKQFATEKTKGNCYCGNLWYFKMPDLRSYLPQKCDVFSGLPREDMLKSIAPYKKVYAVGRCAIEAKILGAEIGVCDHRYPDPSFWKVVDNKEAAVMLQKELDKLEKEKSNVSNND